MPSWKIELADVHADDLLRNWRWLCPQEVNIAAASAFGDLVLSGSDGRVYLLDINLGTLKQIAESQLQFETNESLQRTAMLAEIAQSLFEKGWQLPQGKCFGYKMPIVFEESSGGTDNIYVADIKEYVAFMGDFHQQLKNVPDGSKVRLSTRNT